MLAIETVSEDPCNPSPCGPNAQCNNGVCTCLAEYQGDPYLGCRPECVLNTDCPLTQTCLRNKCVDPCILVIKMQFATYTIMCTCPAGMTSNAFVFCNSFRGIRKLKS